MVCGRPSCKLCLLGMTPEKKAVPCHRTNVGYGIQCTRTPCYNNGAYVATYQGESSKSGYTRIGQHWELYLRNTQKAKEASWMWEHTNERHGGQKGEDNGIKDYTPVLYSSFNDCLTRILDESTRIKTIYDDKDMLCLNTILSYFKPEFVRLVAERGLWDELGLRKSR